MIVSLPFATFPGKWSSRITPPDEAFWTAPGRKSGAKKVVVPKVTRVQRIVGNTSALFIDVLPDFLFHCAGQAFRISTRWVGAYEASNSPFPSSRKSGTSKARQPQAMMIAPSSSSRPGHIPFCCHRLLQGIASVWTSDLQAQRSGRDLFIGTLYSQAESLPHIDENLRVPSFTRKCLV